MTTNFGGLRNTTKRCPPTSLTSRNCLSSLPQPSLQPLQQHQPMYFPWAHLFYPCTEEFFRKYPRYIQVPACLPACLLCRAVPFVIFRRQQSSCVHTYTNLTTPTPHHSTPHHTTPHTPHHTTPHHTTPHHTHYITSHHTTLHHTTPRHTGTK